MASQDYVGEVSKYDLITEDNLGNIYYSYLNKNGLKINSAARYADVDRASRAVITLLTNFYNNTYLTTDITIINNETALGDVQSLFWNSKDAEETTYKTLINVGETRVNPDVQQSHVQTYLRNGAQAVSANTTTSMNAITVVSVNEQMAG